MKLTVIIRDDTPLIYCGDSPSYRTVSFSLTDEQVKMLELKNAEEQYSASILERLKEDGKE